MGAPGPPALGRGVVVAGAAPPPAWAGSPVVTVDDGRARRPGRRRAGPARGLGRRAGRSSSTWPSTRPASGPRRPGRSSRGRWSPASSRPSTASSSWSGPTPTTPAATRRSGGGPARRPASAPTEDGPGRRRAPRRHARRGSTAGPAGPSARTGSTGRSVVHRESVDLGPAAGRPTAVAPDRRPGPRPAGGRGPRRRGRPASWPRPARARPASSPSGCATCWSTGATTGRRCWPWPTTSGPSWSWRSAAPPSGPGSAP